MKPVWILHLFTLWQAIDITSSCTTENWWRSFDKTGHSTCSSLTRYINGFYRSPNAGVNDIINRLEQASCCPRPQPYLYQPTGCVMADWVTAFDRYVDFTYHNSLERGFLFCGKRKVTCFYSGQRNK